MSVMLLRCCGHDIGVTVCHVSQDGAWAGGVPSHSAMFPPSVNFPFTCVPGVVCRVGGMSTMSWPWRLLPADGSAA